jgi:hypothetical protein
MVIILMAIAVGQSPAVGKDQYTLVNPTPRELMREMSTDRPDTTESPYTVDAGHVQMEMSFVDFTREGSENSWSAAPVNLKIGLLNTLDLQLGFNPLLIADGGSTGHGDLVIRAKWNLWGNDEGDTALAIMPFIKAPTATDEFGNGEVEGGVIVPLAVSLPEEWGLGLMAEWDLVHDDDDDLIHEFVHTATVGHPLIGIFDGYVEYVGVAPSERSYRAVVGVGVTAALSGDVQWDAGVNVGLTGEADDLIVFTGVSFRF